MTKSEAINWLGFIKYHVDTKIMAKFDIEAVEALTMAIEALKGDMYCPQCGVRLVAENEYVEPQESSQAELIRCKECKHYEELKYDPPDDGWCNVPALFEDGMWTSAGMRTSADGYCHRAERREA